MGEGTGSSLVAKKKNEKKSETSGKSSISLPILISNEASTVRIPVSRIVLEHDVGARALASKTWQNMGQQPRLLKIPTRFQLAAIHKRKSMREGIRVGTRVDARGGTSSDALWLLILGR